MDARKFGRKPLGITLCWRNRLIKLVTREPRFGENVDGLTEC